MGNFWSYVESFQRIQPCTTVLVVSMVAIFIWQCVRKVQPDAFAFRYELVVEHGEWWRCLTASFSHLGIFHLLMNMVSLWFLSGMEQGENIHYLKSTLILILGTEACQVVAGWLLLRYKASWLHLTNGAGYSGVLFGWLMIYAMREPLGSTSVFGLGVPNLVLPFVYLFGTQLLIRRVSFIGHLSGIVIGLLVALGVFRWWDHYLLLVVACWLPLFFLYNVKTHSDFPLPWLSVVTPALQSSRVRDGHLVHSERDKERTRERNGATTAMAAS